MCGIIAYNGSDNAVPYLVDGIKNLEYRGYDSAGCVLLDGSGNLLIRKSEGKVGDVIKNYAIDKYTSPKGIFHTRWATRGEVNTRNAHPISDCTGKIAVAHNGIIENYDEIKNSLSDHKFTTDTDTEIIAHFLEDRMNGGLTMKDAVAELAHEMKGYSSFVAIDRDSDDIVALKNGSPLVVGLASNGTFVASDVPSFIKYTNRVVYLFDGDVVSIGKSGYRIDNLSDSDKKHEVKTVKIKYDESTKGDFPHFMLKEIMEQPAVVGRIEESGIESIERAAELVKASGRVYLIGAGTSFNACMIAANLFRSLGMDATAIEGQNISNYAGVISDKDLFILISQSGETMDVIQALDLIKANKKIGILNVEGSTLSNSVDVVVYIGAGHENAVAATKTFTASVVYAMLIGMYAAGKVEEARNDLGLLKLALYNTLVPSVIGAVDATASLIKDKVNLFYLGRGADYVTALEGALKMKEVSYIHAEGIDSSTFKHGPLALISKDIYSIALVSDADRDAVMHNLSEIKARGGRIIGISNHNSELFDFYLKSQPAGIFDFVPKVVISQLLAYKVSVLKGINPDRPRNLAKAVTVK